MTRRQTGLWAGVVLGAVLMGCQTTTAPVTTEITSSKAFLSDGMMFGPEGGTLALGNYTLSVPPGAVSEPTFLSITQENNGAWPVRFGPEGTQFTVPVTLTFDARKEADPNSMTIAWWNPSTGNWVDQLSSNQDGVVSTQASHFSRYVLH